MRQQRRSIFNKQGGSDNQDWVRSSANSSIVVPNKGRFKPIDNRAFHERPLEVKQKTKVVEWPKPVVAAFHIELARLVSRYLDTASSFTAVIQFENAASKLCEEYGVTLAVSVSGNDITVDTEEIIQETAGELHQYQMFADAVHGGVKVKDDVDILYNPNASDEDKRLLK